MAAAGIAKHVAAQTAMVTALGKGEEGTAVRTFQPVLVSDLLDGKVEGGHGVGKVHIRRDSRMGMLEIGSLLNVRALLMAGTGQTRTAAFRRSRGTTGHTGPSWVICGPGGPQDPSHGGRRGTGGTGWGIRDRLGRCFFCLGTRPLRDLPFVIDVEGFASRGIVHDLPIGGKRLLPPPIVVHLRREERSRARFFDPSCRRIPLSLASDVIGVKDPPTLWVDTFDPSVVHCDFVRLVSLNNRAVRVGLEYCL